MILVVCKAVVVASGDGDHSALTDIPRRDYGAGWVTVREPSEGSQTGPSRTAAARVAEPWRTAGSLEPSIIEVKFVYSSEVLSRLRSPDEISPRPIARDYSMEGNRVYGGQ